MRELTILLSQLCTGDHKVFCLVISKVVKSYTLNVIFQVDNEITSSSLQPQIKLRATNMFHLLMASINRKYCQNITTERTSIVFCIVIPKCREKLHIEYYIGCLIGRRERKEIELEKSTIC